MVISASLVRLEEDNAFSASPAEIMEVLDSVFARRKAISTDEAALVAMCNWLVAWFLLGYSRTN